MVWWNTLRLKSSNPEVRRKAVESLDAAGDARSLELLLAVTGDEDAQVRCAAIKGLGQVRDDQSIIALATALQDPDSGVREAAAIGLPHDVKGNIIHAFVILKAGQQKNDNLVEELRNHVAKEIGAFAKPEAIEIVESLPKTRSGKIMRRVLKARYLGTDTGDISTLEDE